MKPVTILLVAFTAGALAGPINFKKFDEDTSCASRCIGSDKFQYEDGKTYEFGYETKTRTTIEGASEDESVLLVKATVQIEVLSPCEFVLKVEDVKLMEVDPANPSSQVYSPGSMEFKRALEAHPLRFAFHDGRIENICPTEGDPIWILNIKRGILSTFQNAMDSLDRDQRVSETDVAGDCDAEYIVLPNSNRDTVIKKTKNLLGCRNRHGYNSAIQATKYSVPSNIQSLPLMRSQHDCQQRITNRKLHSASCVEKHVFRPFSKGSSGAFTETTQKLKFNRENSDVRSRPAYVNTKKDMHFEHVPIDGADSSAGKVDAESRLKKLCIETREDIRPQTPQLFADLVYRMRDLDLHSLKYLYHKAKSTFFCRDNSERTRKFFLDAIPMVGTKASVALIEDLISKKIVSGVEADVWITSLAFIPNPTQEILAEIKPLLTSKPTGKIMLAVSALVNNYCRVTSCVDDRQVEDIINIYEKNLGYQCDVQGNDMEKIIFSLRSIGNTGHALPAVPTLIRCMSKAESPMEIRLGAVDAFRRMPCQADKNGIMTLFRSKEEDAELRIAAYLALMECPTEWVLEQVKVTLEGEEVNQVGSFVWSHLTNLMETSDPHKQEIRAILEDETLKKEFDMDKRKFSRNYETSFFLERLNTGAKVESNVIWSSKSFVPRSAMLNLTVDLFGHAINLIEVGGRVEGLEHYLENLFGPEGFFQDKGAKDAWRRSKREIVRHDKLDRISQRYGVSNPEMTGSMYLKMFGNELRYMTLGGQKKSMPNLMDMLIKLSQQNDYQITQNIMFMDSTMVIPTSAGLPLKLTVNGTASVDLKVSGKADIRKLTSRPSNMHIEGVIQPSGAIELTSTMMIDAYVVRSGLRMVSTLHTSTATNGKIQIKNGQIFNVELDSPREKMEIINLNTKFFILHRDAEREQKMIVEDRKTKTICTGERLAKLTGLELCGDLSYTNASMEDKAPYFPFTGPISVGVNLFKRDTHSGYTFTAKYIKDGNQKSARIAFDTPNSKQDRQLVADIQLDTAQNLEINLISPWKSAAVKGSIENGKNLKKVTASLIIDKRREYDILTEVRIDRSARSVKLIPLIEISAPAMKKMTLGGTIEKIGVDTLEKLNVDMSMQNILKKPVNVKCAIVNNDGEKSVIASYSLGHDSYSSEARLLIEENRATVIYKPSLVVRRPQDELVNLDSTLQYNPKKVSIDLTLDKVFKDPLRLSGRVLKSESRRKLKRTLNVSLKSPILTFDLDANMDKKKAKKPILTSKVTLNYQMRQVGKDRVSLSYKLKNLSTQTLTKFSISANADSKRNPEYNFNTEANFERNPTSMETGFEFQYGDNIKDEHRKITFSETISHKLNKMGRTIDLKSKLKFPEKGIDYEMKAAHKHSADDLSSNVLLRYNTDKEITASINLQNDMKKKQKMSGSVSLGYPGRNMKLTSEVAKVGKKEYSNTIDASWGKGSKATIRSTYRNPAQDSHEITSTIHVAKLTPLTIEGSVNLDPRNRQLSVNAMRGKDKSPCYGLTLSCKSGAMAHDGKVDFIYPDWRVVAEIQTEPQSYSSKLDVKWDAVQDPSQRLVVNTNLEYHSMQDISGAVNVEYPGRKIKSSIRHQGGNKYISHADFEWAEGKSVIIDTTFSDKESWSSRSLGGSLHLSTPFEPIEYIQISGQHTTDRRQFLTQADLAWSPRDKVEGTFTLRRPASLRDLQTKLVLKTPIPEYENINVEIVHKLTNELDTLVKGEVGAHSLEVKVTGSNKGDRVRTDLFGEVTMKSSYPPLRSVSVSASHSDDGRKYDSAMTVDLGTNSRYSVDLGIEHTRYSYQIRNEGKLQITTPIQGLEKITTTWEHSNTEKNVQSKITTVWGRKKFHIDLDASHDSSYRQRLITANFNLQTPLAELRELTIIMKHDHKENTLQCTGSMLRNRYRKTEYAIAYTLDDDYNIDSSIMFVCPGIDEVKAKLNTKLSERPQTAQVEVEWSPRERITLAGELSRSGLRYVDSTVRFTSPFYRFERLVLSARHAQDRNRDWVSSASLEISPRQTINIETKINYDNVLLGQVTITTPFPELEKLMILGEHKDLGPEKQSRAQFELLPYVGKIEANAGFEDAGEMKGHFRLDTPFRIIPYSQAKFSYQRGDSKTGHVEIEYLPNEIISLDTEYRLTDLRDLSLEITLKTPITSVDYIKTTFNHRGDTRQFRSLVSVEYPRRNAFSGTVNFRNTDQLEASVDLQAPNMDDVRVSVSKSGTLRDLHYHGMITYEGYKKIDGDLTFSLNRGRKGPVLAFGATAKTPVTKDLKITLNHEGNILDFKTNVEALYGRSETVKVSLSSDLIDKVELNADIAVNSQYTRFRSASTALNLKGELRNFEGDFRGSYEGQTIAVTGLFKSSAGIQSSLTINTPFDVLRHVTINLRHTGNLQKFSTNADLDYDGKRFEAVVVFSNQGRIDMTITIKTPIPRFEDLSAKLDLAGDLNELDTKASIQYASGKVIDISGKLDLVSDSRKFEVTIHTPFNGYESISTAGQFTGELSRFESTAHVQYATGKRIEVKTSLDLKSDRKSFSAVVTTPFSKYEQLSAEGNLNGSPTHFSADAHVVYYRGQRIEVNANFDIDSVAKVVNVDVKTPFRDFEEISVGGKFEGELTRFTANVDAQYRMGKRINLSGDVNMEKDPKTISAILRTPFSGYEELSAIANFNGYSKRFTTDAQITYAKNQRLEANADVDLEGSKQSLTAEIRTPFRDYERMSVGATYKGRLTRFSSDAYLEYAPGKKINLEASSDIEGDKKSLSTSLKTPFRTVRDVSAKTSFKHVSSRISGEAEVQYNGKKIEVNGDVDTDFSLRLEVKTPFPDFEKQSASVSLTGPAKKFSWDTKIEYGKKKLIELKGEFDIDSETKKIHARLTTPFPYYESQGVIATLVGSSMDFQAMANVDASAMRKPIQARASLRYKTPTDMDATVTFSSAIPHAKILKLTLKNSYIRKYTSQLEVTWAPGKTIVLESNCDVDKGYRRTKTIADISISSPFPSLRQASIKMELDGSETRHFVKLSVDQNKQNLLDVSVNVGSGEKKSLDINLRNPRPMQLQATGSLDSDVADGTVFINWDKRDAKSNIKITMLLNDASDSYTKNIGIDIQIVHPTHTLGIKGKIESSFYRWQSSGEISWDDKKSSYEAEWNDRSRSYTNVNEVRVRINSPYRSVEVRGTHNDDTSKVLHDLVLSWDVERDPAKKIIATSMVQRSANYLKSDLKLEMPSIRSEIRLLSEATLRSGRTLFDGKTEFSYARDERKKLTISSKIEDTSVRYGENSNYTMTLAISHPYTQTDVRITSHAGKDEHRMSAAMNVDYLTAKRQRQNMDLRGEIDQLKKLINFEMSTPIKTIQVSGKVEGDSTSGYHVSVRNIYDKSTTINSDLVIDPKKGSVTFTMNDIDNPRNTMNIQAGYIDDKSVAVEVYRMSRGQRITDALLALRLNSSRILHTRIHWRPTVYREIMEALDYRLKMLKSRSVESAKDALQDISQEWSLKRRAISNAFIDDMAPLLDLVAQEWRRVDLELADIMKELNELGLERLLEAMQNSLQAIMRYSDKLAEKTMQTYREIEAQIERIIKSANLTGIDYEQIIQLSADLLKEYYIEVTQFLDESAKAIVERIEPVAQYIFQQYYKIDKTYKNSLRRARKLSGELADKIWNHHRVQALKAKYDDLIDKLPSVPSLDKVKEVSSKLQDKMKSYSSSLGQKYAEILDQAREKIIAKVSDILNSENIRYAHSIANEVIQQGKWAVDYWKVEENIVNFLRSLLRNVRNLAMEEIKDLRDNILNLDKSRIIVYDPKHGEIQFEIYLPIPMSSLRELPEINVEKYVKKYSKLMRSYIPARNFSIWDKYYSLKPSTDILNLIPPFKASAFVAGKQHFVTFDGRHFDFAGLCSYVLAHDFMDGNFSIILNYDGDWSDVKKRSLMILDGSKQIEIFPDYKVQVDGRPQELPCEFKSTKVIREGDIIRVESKRGISVDCDMAHDIYAVTISGWYYGKTAGLLGTYDNEPGNDLVTSSRQAADNIQSFAHSWEIAGSCRSSRNYARPAVMEPGRPGYRQCHALFMDDNSPFRPCFAQVEHQSTFAMCLEDFALDRSETAICNASALYIRRCKQKGVHLEMPRTCVRCDSPVGGLYEEGTKLLIPDANIHIPRSADVIFVVEEKECNKNSVRELQTLVQSIESALRSSRLSKNQYGLVGYGGSKIMDKVHSHTIDGKLLNNARKFGVGVDALNFDKSGDNDDVLEAVLFAASYPFRAGVSKTIILMPCSSCQITTTSYSKVLTVLNGLGIKLHLLKEHDFEFGSNKSPKSTDILGIGNEGAYTYQNRRDKTLQNGNSSLLSKLSVPEDNCIALTQNTNGTLFNVARLTKGRVRMQKSFRDVWARRLAQAAQPSDCQSCRCQSDENGVGRSVCSQCGQAGYYQRVLEYLMPNSREESRPQYQENSDNNYDFNTQLKTYMAYSQ